MGLISLIKNVAGTVTGTIGDEIRDQYLEFFTCDSLGDNILVKEKRLAKAEEELSYKPYFDRVVVNDDLQNAFKQLDAIIETNS